MRLFDWLFGWKPEKYVWYSFYDVRKSLNDWTHALERFDYRDALKIAPFVYIRGKKYRGKFYLTRNYCEIIAGNNKIIVPVSRCSFRQTRNEYYQGQAHVTEYRLVLIVRDLAKEDYDRYKKFKKK